MRLVSLGAIDIVMRSFRAVRAWHPPGYSGWLSCPLWPEFRPVSAVFHVDAAAGFFRFPHP